MIGDTENEMSSLLQTPKIQHILNCSLPTWYAQYRDSTLKSCILKLPKAVLDYLRSDGLFLPDEQNRDQGTIISDWEQGESESNADVEALFANSDFLAFQQKVVGSIDRLDGKCFPKLDWSAPRDATWIALNNSLCCRTFNDILLLLKSSEFITHDLTNPFLLEDDRINAQSVQHHLVLREWTEINPVLEFRMFIHVNRIIAISHRYDQYSEHVDSSKLELVRKLKKFFSQKIQGKFPESNFTVDVYLNDVHSEVVLVDFNTWSGATDGLLFDWQELATIALGGASDFHQDLIEGVILRTANKNGSGMPSLHQYSVPLDIQHLATGEDANKLIDLMKAENLRDRSDESSD